MKWADIVAKDRISSASSCQLIVVGETWDGTPFCLEDSFEIASIHGHTVTVTHAYKSVNPFETLRSVRFTEMSFRYLGILYHAFVDLNSHEFRKGSSVLTFTVPEGFDVLQNRQFARIHLPPKTPITCGIVGVRQHYRHQPIPFQATLLDICGGGLSLVTTNRLFYPLYLDMRFTLPEDPENYALTGEVVRVAMFGSNAYRVAVEFRNISVSLVDRIDEYCSSRATL